MDYLTKWPEDQTALTIGKLRVEEIISQHGVPRELLCDRDALVNSEEGDDSEVISNKDVTDDISMEDHHTIMK